MTEQWIYPTVEFLITYWIHSSLFVGMALFAAKLEFISADEVGEKILKGALLAGILTGLIAVNLPSLSFSSPQSQPNDIVNHVSVSDNFNQQYEPVLVHEFQPSNQPATENVQSNLVLPPLQKTADPKWSDKLLISLSEVTVTLFYLWLCGALFLLSCKLYQFYRLHQLLNDRRLIQDSRIRNMLEQLREKAQYKREIQVFESDSIQSPLVFKKHEIVLPIEFMANYSERQAKAALAHELAHLKRKDTQWLKISLVVEVLFFFQPLNNLFNRVIHQVAEQRSDQLASEWTNSPRALVEALSVAAHIQLQSSQSKMVFAMKSNKSNLVNRVEKLLTAKKQKTHKLKAMLSVIFSFIVLTIIPGYTIPVANAVKNTEKESVSHKSYFNTNDSGRISLSTTQRQGSKKFAVKAELDGMFSVNNEETEIVDFPEDSYLDISYEEGSTDRKLEISRNSGAIEYRFYVDGEKRAYNQEAQQWFASVIPELFRVTGLNAKQRVKRIRTRDGDKGVLREVMKIKSDYVKASYLNHLFRQSQLSSADKLLAIELSTDIQSDFEQARVLKSILKTQPLDADELWFGLFKASKEISSDFELANMLKEAVNALPGDEKIQLGFFEISENISSDFEMRNLFSHFLKERNSREEEVARMLNFASEINSDFELSSLLIQAVEEGVNSELLLDAYLKVSKSINSDFEMARAFKRYLDTNPKPEFLVKVLDIAADNIGSDHELATLLVQASTECQLDNGVERAIKDSLKSVGSRHEKGRVLISLEEKSCS